MKATDVLNEEQQLVERVSKGDQEAFRVLFDRFHHEIYRFCALLLGKGEGVDDVYQETFFAFYRMCRAGESINNVHGLLLTIARNRCLNQLKVEEKKLPLDSVPERSSDMDMDAFDLEDQLQKAMVQIPIQYREALLLYEIEGYSYKEIADYLDITLHVVKNRIYYAKRALRSLLERFSSQ